ncbi:hypothetical protein [Nonomuraea sp. NPDC003214]
MTGDGRGPHDAPSAAELVAAVREFLTADVLPAVEGGTRCWRGPCGRAASTATTGGRS